MFLTLGKKCIKLKYVVSRHSCNFFLLPRPIIYIKNSPSITCNPMITCPTLSRLNSTGTLHLKGHSLKAPNLSEIKFDPLSINHSVYTEEGAVSPHPFKEQRTKRGVLHLFNMVSCATGCNPLTYKGYGCYCGFLGSGYAVDGIDR